MTRNYFDSDDPPDQGEFASAVSSMFRRVGASRDAIAVVNGARGSASQSSFDGLWASYLGADQWTPESCYAQLESWRRACDPVVSYLRAIASRAVVEAMGAFSPNPDRSIEYALVSLISYMDFFGETVRRNTPTISVSKSSTNPSDAVVAATLVDERGLVAEGAYAERILAATMTDFPTGTAAQGRETLRFVGERPARSSSSEDAPGGSGCATSIRAVDPLSTDGGSGADNRLRNGSLETWYGDTPAYWPVLAGTPGSSIFRESVDKKDSLYSLKFIGDGGEEFAITQPFGSVASGTPATIQPNKIYAFNMWVHSDAGAGADVEVSLRDLGGGPTYDAAGGENTASMPLSEAESGWTPFSGFVRTPPGNVVGANLRVAFTAPVASGVEVKIDRISFVEATRLYPGGPHAAVFSGTTPLMIGNSFAVDVENPRDGEIQSAFAELFDMYRQGLLLPSAPSGSETYPDSWI